MICALLWMWSLGCQQCFGDGAQPCPPAITLACVTNREESTATVSCLLYLKTLIPFLRVTIKFLQWEGLFLGGNKQVVYFVSSYYQRFVSNQNYLNSESSGFKINLYKSKQTNKKSPIKPNFHVFHPDLRPWLAIRVAIM